MKSKNSALYQHFMKRSSHITDEWLSNTPIQQSGLSTAKQYKEFVQAVINILTEKKPQKEWKAALECARKLARDKAVIQAPIHESLKGFKIFRRIFMDEIETFSNESAHDISKKEAFEWSKRLNLMLDEFIEQFMDEYDRTTIRQLHAQKEMIRELSVPVIPISNHIGVLPLIGEIDTNRAKVILESALEQCAELHLTHLFIDISGVPIVDTMVAYQLFRVVDSTRLLGIETIISGIRPEIAQTVVKIGIDFSNIKTEQSLAVALSKKGFRIWEGDVSVQNDKNMV
ncbi:STAS domain-containing protein [Bacillus sonorensis]|uniref:STAS domain-containing protein n=1 Tax=Bacillus sonorensis TaxID=119858 RepID=UPI0022801239|nr:STAS domain-containing protein [Bacillus sonorensis]MCY8404943.1 STAS domain-containing protein [Bacillus sonorensis]MEC1438776.1 STAS domain-containing protein [Bacillus sonorensis]